MRTKTIPESMTVMARRSTVAMTGLTASSSLHKFAMTFADAAKP